MVAASVEPLVVGSGDRGECRQERRAREAALGVVRVQPHLLQLVGAQRARLLPDPRVDRDPSEVVDEAGAPDRGRARGVDPATPGGLGCKLGDARRMTGEVRRDQIGEAAHRGEPAVERVALEHQRRRGLHGESFVPCGAAVVERKDRGAALDQAGRHLGVEGVAGALADDAHRMRDAPEVELEGGVGGHVDDPHRQRDLLVLSSPQRTVAVPAVGQVGEKVRDRCGSAGLLGEHPGNLAGGGERRARLPRHPRQPPGGLGGACRAR